MDRLQRWANNNILKRIYLDELQQLIVEYGFRSVYQSLRKIGRVGVPVMCLSGSLPDCMAMSLMRYCSLTTSHNNESIDTVEAIDPVGDGYSLVVNIVDNVSASVVDFVSGVRYGACHVICESKQIVTAVAAGLSMSYKVLTVTGDSSSNEQVHCAKAWLEGSYDVLVSTVVALVGNENPNCKTIVIAGFLYNASNLVQAIGRLRPEQRGSESFVQVFRLSFHTQDRVNAKSASIKTFNEIVSANCLPDTSKEKFFHLFTPWGLQKFLGLKKGCLLEELSSYYGFQRPKCDRCTLCLKSSTISSEKNHGVIVDHKDYGDRLMCQENILDKSRKDVKSCYSDSNAAVKRARIGEPSLICSEVNSAKLSADKQRSQEQQIMRRAECVFSELAYRCIACSRADCIGECGRGCYRCGDLMHQTNTCTYNVTRLSTILCNKGVCFGCFDTKQRGIDTHNIKECPLKRRLKRLMFLDREKKQGIFEDYLRSLYASELSFLDMVASFSDRVTLGQ